MKKMYYVIIIAALYCSNIQLSASSSCDRDDLSQDCTQNFQRSFDCDGGCSSGSCREEEDNTAPRGFGTPFLPRPQGLNSAVFFNPFWYTCGLPGQCFFAQVGYRYNQTFRDEQIARCIFGSEALFFSGSKAANRRIGDLLADNFGLAPNFRGRIHFDPRIKNHIIDFSSRIELGSWSDCFERMYVACNASLVHSSWQLKSCEVRQTVTADTFSELPVCYMNTSTQTPLEPAGDIRTALSGDFLFGDMQTRWRFGRFDFFEDDRQDTKLANIDVILGWDFLLCDDYHVGAFLKAVAPTGTKPNGRRIFENVIGNGHHWEFGGGLDAHYQLWSCDDQCVTLHINGCATHLFKDSQFRTFDFGRSKADIPGFFSRYVLLKQFDANNNYAGRLINAVNFTTQKIKSSFAVQGDAAIRCVYHICNWAIGLGYNVYGRSTEKISGPCTDCREFSRDRFGIKGINGVCARGFTPGVGLNGQTFILASTSSKARAFNSKQLATLVDNPVTLDNFVNWDSPTDPNTPPDQLIQAIDSQIDGKPAPVFVRLRDIRLKGIPSQLTHKVFAHIDYRSPDCSFWQPYVGVGGEVEFAHNGDCSLCTASQWGVWLRAGTLF